MPEPNIVVIGASAGGLQALTDVVEHLPAATRAAIFVVMHTTDDGDSFLPQILGRKSKIPVAFAQHGTSIKAGTIAVAPPGQHLLVMRKRTILNRGPKENGFRPAVDPLFRTAARAHGARAMGIILSGALDDGTYGLKMIKDHGGMAVVQDPEEATHPSMPLSALRTVKADHVLRAAGIGVLIAKHCADGAEGVAIMARPEEPEPQNPAEETGVEDMEQNFGPPSGLTCPDCGGALWEIRNGELTRYRCHVGHQYTPEALDAGHREVVEGALWSAVRVLEEHSDLRRRMSKRAQERGLSAVSAGFAESAEESDRQAATIRQLLFGRHQPQATPEAADPEATVRVKGKRRPA
ncbi:MAG: chemotaxis protein CheB [Cyanobacteria bacterium]|nr:chemotaxis protein CheB [Cyanobacteriota bacterium]